MTPRSTVKRVRHLASGLFRFCAVVIALLTLVTLGFVVVDPTGSGLASALTGALLALGAWWIAVRLAPTPDGLRRAPGPLQELGALLKQGVSIPSAPIATLRKHLLRRAAIARWDASPVIQNGRVVADDDVREVSTALRDLSLSEAQLQSVVDSVTARYGAGGR